MSNKEFPCGCKIDTDCLNFNKINYECSAVWNLLSRGLVCGIFQLETLLGKQWTQKLKPETIEHLAALGSILRPGALRAVDENNISITEHYCRRKNKQEPSEIFDKSIEDILSSSYQSIIFQEQIMQIAVKVAGFTPQEADILRKAIGHKVASIMSECKTRFIDGVDKVKVISKEKGEKLFDWIEKSNRYLFNKSVSSDTIIRRKGTNSNKVLGYKIGHLYNLVNSIEYAKKHGHESLRKRLKGLGNFGYGLSLCADNRIRGNLIKNISYSGKQDIYKVTLENGYVIKTTNTHKFPTPLGIKSLNQLFVGDKLYICGTYESCSNKYNYRKLYNTDYKNTKNTLIKQCYKCNKVNCRLKLHHKDKDRTNSNLNNLEYLCVSCHKIVDEEKGYPVLTSKITSIDYVGIEDTYDVEMESPNHNFVTGTGIITGNSHAVSYGRIGYICAWLKAHFPLEFYCGWLKHANEKFDCHQEISNLINEAKLLNIEVKPPQIEHAEANFYIKDKCIFFGLSNIKGIGINQVEKLKPLLGNISQERSWYDILRQYSGQINKTVLTNIIKVGGFDNLNLGLSRNQMLHQYDLWNNLTLLEKSSSITSPAKSLVEFLQILLGEKCSKNRIQIVKSLIDIIKKPCYSIKDSSDWVSKVEKDLLGISLTCCKTDMYGSFSTNCSCKEFLTNFVKNPTIVCNIDKVYEREVKNGNNAGKKMASIIVSDKTGSLDNVVVFPDVYENFRNLVNEGNVVVINGQKGKENNSFIVRQIFQPERGFDE